MEFTVILLFLLFLVLLFTIGRAKGFRALLSFGLTVLLFIGVIIPLIVRGFDPVVVVLVSAVPILALIIYFTEGFNILSHVSIVATALNFAVISILIELSVWLAHLTGLVSDVASTVGASGIDAQELLIAGIMLGTLGVLTEMVVTQVATVFELAQSNPVEDPKKLYRQAYNVGMAHVGSIITTLFLVYAGVSMPLLVIFMGEHGSLAHALNYEPLVEEIIRTLVGTIGLVIAMPISTRVAIWWIKKKAV
ncbi:MAG: YibE/F family protein [Patescibacteria group bacterium]